MNEAAGGVEEAGLRSTDRASGATSGPSDRDRAGAPAVEARDLVKRFLLGPTVVEVLSGVSFTLAAGDSVAVAGPSGSGKSTLLHVLGTLERPSSGAVRLAGEDPFALSERELARLRNERIGFVFQDHHLLPQYTVLENVLLPALAFGRVDAARRERARALLARVGLAAREAHRPSELSGGERQRAAIARALLHAPRLLLCDEPTGQLDARNAAAVTDLLLELHGEGLAGGEGARVAQAGDRAARGVLVVATHSPAVASRLGRRFELAEGRCCEA